MLFASVVLQGCATEPTDLSTIKPKNSRAEIEAVLGEPLDTVQTDVGQIATYRYDLGSAGAYEHTSMAKMSGRNMGGCYGCIIFLLATPIELLVHADDRNWGVVSILYATDERILADFYGLSIAENSQELIAYSQLVTHAEGGDPNAQYQMAKLMDEENRLIWYRKAAQQGNAEAQFALAETAPTVGSRQYWLCRAAHQGNKDAQLKLSTNYWNGYDDLPVDQVRAYTWYSLAMEGCPGAPGYCPNEVGRNFFAKHMTSSQVAEAEHLVAEWKPNPSACGTEGQAANEHD